MREVSDTLRRSRGVLVALLCVAGGLTAGCTSSGSGSSVHFGMAAAIGPAPTVSLPSAAQGVTLSVHPAATRITRGNDPLWGVDQQLGTAYRVSVSREPVGAVIHFRVDPRRLRELALADGGSGSQLFVELYEPALQTWFPLRSRYDAATRTVSAVAPHLSTVALGWVVTKLARAISVGVSAVAMTAAEFTKSFVSEVKDTLSPEQQSDGCDSRADSDWIVRSRISRLTGCISTSDAHPLLLENPLLVPLDVGQPPGPAHASLLAQDISRDSLPQFLERGLVWVTGATLVPPHGAAVIPMNAANFTGGGAEVATSANVNMIADDVILGLLAVLPPDREWTTEVEAVEQRVVETVQREETANPGSVSQKTFLEAIAKDVQPDATNVPSVLNFTDLLTSAFDCVDQSAKSIVNTIQSGTSGLPAATFDTITKIGLKCFSTAMEALGKNVNENLKYALSLILSIPDLIEKTRETVQWVALGPGSVFSQTYILRASAASPVSESEFVTSDGRIECANAEVQGAKTEGLPITDHDPTMQSTVCFVKGYTGPAPEQPCFDLPRFTVHLDFGFYPTADKCAGELPKELSPNPYQVPNGGWVNLGGATCHAEAPTVTCVSNSFEGTSFTVSPTDLSRPILPNDTVKFAAAGFASNQAVRPPVLQISGDSSFDISHVHYTEWTQQKASGTGILDANNCVPNCAGGKETHTPTYFTLDTPVLACGDFFFTRVLTGPSPSTEKPDNTGAPVMNNVTQETPCDVLYPQH
jgi:hypothetical protein